MSKYGDGRVALIGVFVVLCSWAETLHVMLVQQQAHLGALLALLFALHVSQWRLCHF